MTKTIILEVEFDNIDEAVDALKKEMRKMYRESAYAAGAIRTSDGKFWISETTSTISITEIGGR